MYADAFICYKYKVYANMHLRGESEVYLPPIPASIYCVPVLVLIALLIFYDVTQLAARQRAGVTL